MHVSVNAHACLDVWDVCVHHVYGPSVYMSLQKPCAQAAPPPRVTHAPDYQQVAPEHHVLGSGEGVTCVPPVLSFLRLTHCVRTA
jgi:hypothetical protein